MNLKYSSIITCLAIAMMMWSCKDDIDLAPRENLVGVYYPIEEGNIRTYLVDSITYDYDGLLQQIAIDTQQYYIQERVVGSILINDEPWWRIGLFRSPTREGNFQLVDYAYIQNTGNQLLRKEGNLTFIPLAGPLEIFTEWDGTAKFNASQAEFFIRGELITPYVDWNYIYLRNWDHYDVEGTTYEQVIQINQSDTSSIHVEPEGSVILPENQLFYTLSNEFYAPDVGLIKKEEYHLTSVCASANVEDFQVFCDSTTIFTNAERGYIYHKKLISIE